MAGDIVRAYVGDELRAKGTVQIDAVTGNPVVALMVSVDPAVTAATVNGIWTGETLSNVFVEEIALLERTIILWWRGIRDST